MIYTSYFDKLKDLPENIIPVSINRTVPDWYTGFQYKKLSPKFGFILHTDHPYHNALSTKYYYELVLDKTTPQEVITDLSKMCYGFNIGENDIALIGYEKPYDFCHRHFVADWLNRNGFRCKEYKFNND